VKYPWTVLSCTDFEIQQYEIEISKELQISAGEHVHYAFVHYD